MTGRPAREGLGDNVRFLLAETSSQVERVVRYLNAPGAAGARELLERDDYIDQLESTITRQCHALEAAPGTDERERKRLGALVTVSANLERIADFCVNIVDQVSHVPRADVRAECDFERFAEQVLLGLGCTHEALEHADVKVALEVCKVERELDRLYQASLRRLTRALATGEHTKRRVATIFITHYFERMGDSLENVGEAIISWLLGDRLKIQQISALGDVLPASGGDEALEEIELQEVGETRSGCHISRVRGANGHHLAIFKHGKLRKLAGEKESIDEWERLIPGLVPAIYSFHVRGDSGAVLYEYLEGTTFQQLLLGGDDVVVERAARAVGATLELIWERTRTDEPARARFVGQLQNRLPAVYAIHPSFRGATQSIAGREHASLDELLDRVATIEERLVAPFSVRIHGDLNVDNIIYRPDEDSVRLIDVHRSRAMDYVQDLTVLLVSGQRLMRLATPVRRRINRVTAWFFERARAFARARGDASFEVRAALGLARSLASSTRYVVDRELSTSMYLRALFLLRHVADHAGAGDYRIPEGALVGW